MTDKNTPEHIDRYLAGQMSEEEGRAFTEAIMVNPDLKEEVQKHRLEREALQVLLAEEYAGKIKSWSAPAFEKIRREERFGAGKIIRLYAPLLRYAAALAGLLVVSAFLWSNLRFTNSAIATRNFIDPEPELLTSLKGSPDIGSASSPAQILLDQVKLAYQSEDFAKGITLLQSQPLTEETTYFLGHLYLAAKDYPHALDAFQDVVNEKSRLQAKAEYYSLLAMLQNNQTDANFYRLLDALSADATHPYRGKAIVIQQALKNNWRKLAW